MAQVFSDLQDLIDSEYIFRITDNRGETADRYTVLFSDGSGLALSSNPSHPQGVSLTTEGVDPAVLEEVVTNGQEDDLSFRALPENIQRHILARVNQGFQDFLDLLEQNCPTSRDKVEANEGIYSSAGVGIWKENGSSPGYYIRRDDNEDLGPYQTVAEALKASLPTPYGLAGPEYHSTAM